jgi:homogentisate 1,2-dioxygenase
MPHYRAVGSIPPKRHTQHRAPDGQLYYEELVGAEGFSADSCLLYHRHIPSAIVKSVEWELGALTTTPNVPLKPRHLRLHDLFASDVKADVVTSRRLLLGNSDVRISYVVASMTSPLYRNAIGDECVYLESGSASVETMYGVLPVHAGDYVILPRGVTHRWLPQGGSPLRAYLIEANSHIGPPKRYLSAHGQLLEQAPYCERDLRSPGEPFIVDPADGVEDASNVDVFVKHRSSRPGGVAGTILTYAQHPFDVVGWDGCLYPYVFNIADFEPITGRIHQPPPVHQVFEATNLVICNFVPRKVDYHPLSIPVPYYHSNVDSDEVMFYCGGDYEARRGSGIGPGSVSLHPGGHAHGPQPGAYERSIGVEYFDELAVMVDTFVPLELGEGAVAAEDPSYAWSWSAHGPTPS